MVMPPVGAVVEYKIVPRIKIGEVLKGNILRLLVMDFALFPLQL